MRMNAMSAFRKRPHSITAPDSSTVRSSEKSGTPSSPSSGVRMPVTNAVTTVANAAPRTKATARSITFPRMTKSRNPLNMSLLLAADEHRLGPSIWRRSTD
jgi:hypothetical protein